MADCSLTKGGTLKTTEEKELVFPTSLQFPFDEVCEQIVDALKQRKWKVLGVDVEFHEDHTGSSEIRFVGHIEGNDFKICFCRLQRTMPDGCQEDIVVVDGITIPKKELRIYRNESALSLYLYVGNDWENDCEYFMNDRSDKSRLRGIVHNYIEYKGDHNLRGVLTQNEIGYQIDPEFKGSKTFLTSVVMEEFRNYLIGVLKVITSHPIQT